MSAFAYPSAEEFQRMTPAEFESFWEAFEKFEIAKTAQFAGRWFVGENDIRDVITLKRAGWKPQPQTKVSQPMAWYWRRAIRPGSRDRVGRLFSSTGQAISELRRDEARKSKSVESFAIELTYDGKPFRGSLPAKGALNAQRMADSIGARVIDTTPTCATVQPAAPTGPIS